MPSLLLQLAVTHIHVTSKEKAPLLRRATTLTDFCRQLPGEDQRDANEGDHRSQNGDSATAYGAAATPFGPAEEAGDAEIEGVTPERQYEKSKDDANHCHPRWLGINLNQL